MFKNNCIIPLSLSLLTILFPHMGRAETPIAVKQGGIVHLSLDTGKGNPSVQGKFLGRTIPFFKTNEGVYSTVLGIDLAQKKGTWPFVVSWEDGDKSVRQEYRIQIVGAKFGIQELTLPKGKVDLDPPTLSRVRREQGEMKEVFSHSIDKKLWNGAFLVPVEGKIQGTFGRRRILNGQARRPHTGEDISAPQGAETRATNSGKIVLVSDFFFNGRSVVIDHGLGLFSMYFHLSEITVEEGMMVQRGQGIGRVGQTGRVTGPHLHWGMRLNGARIDPFSLVDTSFD
ncbi:MAG: M23 family metallopeptidase [Nitrospiria bacterium]